jgi:inner membrane protein
VSSFIGHGLAAVGIFLAGERSRSRALRTLWLGWLILLAWAPDVDYVLAALRMDGIRRSHSIALVLLLPAITTLVLWLAGMRGRELKSHSIQAAMAGLSHLVLDMLVGVTALPLLWPASSIMFRLPFGVLPSAGRLDMYNPLLWRNWLIELGVLVPLLGVVGLMSRKTEHRRMIVPVLVFVSAGFALWAALLER